MLTTPHGYVKKPLRKIKRQASVREKTSGTSGVYRAHI